MVVRDQLKEIWNEEKGEHVWVNIDTGQTYLNKPYLLGGIGNPTQTFPISNDACLQDIHNRGKSDVTDLVRLRNELARKVEEARLELTNQFASEQAAVRIQRFARGFLVRKNVLAWFFSDCVEVCYDRTTGRRFFYDLQHDTVAWTLPNCIESILRKLALFIAQRATASSSSDPCCSGKNATKFGSHYQVLLASAELEASFLDGLAWECMKTEFGSSSYTLLENGQERSVTSAENHAKRPGTKPEKIKEEDYVADQDISILCLQRMILRINAAITIQSFWRSCTAQWVAICKIVDRYEKVWDDAAGRYFYFDTVSETSSWHRHAVLRRCKSDLPDPIY
jgi:hypothetical protein